MRKLLQFAILAILAGAPLMRAQALRGAPGGMPKGIPKNGIAKKGPRLPGPTGAVERLLAMPPEQREQVLEKLPPPQQEALRKRFEQFDKRPPEERARLLKQWKQFESLSPETRELRSTK
jgi:hypothetical protein